MKLMLPSMNDYEWINIKPEVDHIVFPDEKELFCLLKEDWLT